MRSRIRSRPISSLPPRTASSRSWRAQATPQPGRAGRAGDQCSLGSRQGGRDGQVRDGDRPDKITSVYNFDWADGSDETLATLGEDGAILDKGFAEDEKLAVGDRFELQSGSGRSATHREGALRTAAFYPLLGSVSILKDKFDSSTTGRATSSPS